MRVSIRRGYAILVIKRGRVKEEGDGGEFRVCRGNSCVRKTIFRSVAGRTPPRKDRRTHYVKSQSVGPAGRTS